MRTDITTLMVRTEGLDKMLLLHEKRLDNAEAADKDLTSKLYNLKFCCNE